MKTSLAGALWLTLFLFAMPASAVAGRIQFGAVSFDPGADWTVTDEGSALLLVPTNSFIKARARVKVGPIQTGDAPDVVAQVWTQLAAGKQVQGKIIDDNNVMSGGRRYRHIARFTDGSSATIILAACGDKCVPFSITADDRAASDLAWTFFLPIMISMKCEDVAGSVAGADDVGTPSALGDDPYDSVPWTGPKEWGFGVFDIHPVSAKRELETIMLLAKAIIGSVPPKDLSYAEAIAHVNAICYGAMSRPQYDEFKKLGSRDPFTLQGFALAGVVRGDSFNVLFQLYAQFELYPDEANNWLNLAAILAHVGLANESMAVLKEMDRRGKKPDPALLSADAVIEYLRGFNRLLLGQTLTAKGHLHKAIDLDPFLKEAKIALAVAQKLTGEDEQAEETYIQGVWRRRPSQVLLCGGTPGEPPDVTPRRPPITDMMDVSHGSAGALPNFDHPQNYSEAIGLKARYEKLILQMKEDSETAARRSVAIFTRLSARPRTSTEVWYGYIDFLMSTLHDEPPVKKLIDARNKAETEMAEAVKRIGKRTGPKVLQLAMQPGDHRRELEDIATDNVGKLRPFAQAFDIATRRLYKIEYRYLTGLATHIGDSEWHDLEVAKLRVQTIGAWSGDVGLLMGSYILVANIVPPPQQRASSANGPESGDLPECPDGIRDLGFKLTIETPPGVEPALSFGIKAACNKMALEVAAYPFKAGGKNLPIDFGAGGFGQVELSGRGDINLFIGATGKAGGEAGAGSAGLSGKAGVYIESNIHDGQIRDFGFKGTVDTTLKLGTDLQLSQKVGQMKVSFVPSLPGPNRGGPLLPDTTIR